MRCKRLCVALVVIADAAAQTPVQTLWKELDAKRVALSESRQEFDSTTTNPWLVGPRKPTVRQKILVDFAGARWREQTGSGTASLVRVFDGEQLFTYEEGGQEFIRTKPAGDETPAPAPYDFNDLRLDQLRIVEEQPCGFSGREDRCVVLEAPQKLRDVPRTASFLPKPVDGTTRMVFDLQTGLLKWRHTHLLSRRPQGLVVRMDVEYDMRRMEFKTTPSAPPPASRFQAPPGAREVKQFFAWDASRVEKDLIGKVAPDLSVTDIQGRLVDLKSLRGKTVLLTYVNSACNSCRADRPALEKLYRQYGSDRLEIVVFWVNQFRSDVEQSLKGHPLPFATVVAAENDLPPPYQLRALTYLIIDKDGILREVARRDQGSGRLRKMLAKAGMDVR